MPLSRLHPLLIFQDVCWPVQERAAPESFNRVQTFLRFANIYRTFIPGYSEMVSYMKALTKKGIKFQLDPCQTSAYTQTSLNLPEALGLNV